MEFVTPEVYHVASTQCHDDVVDKYLKDVGAEGWKTDAHSGAEKLIEVGGRM